MTHRQNFFRKYDLEDRSYSLEELAKISGYKKSVLQEVYNRGTGAYKSSPPSGIRRLGTFLKGGSAPKSARLSKQQWSFARVYSFLDGNPKHDNDLR
jgi:hypothetical protein